MTTTWTTKQVDFPYLSETAQAIIIAADYAEALMMDYAKSLVVVATMASGLKVTQGMIWNEIRATRAPRPTTVAPLAYHQFSSPSFRW